MTQTQTKSDDFYSRFYYQLLESQSWPGIYLFKFIVKTESQHLITLKNFFDNLDTNIIEKSSSKNNFTSLSVKVKMDSPESVIQIYKKAADLEGIIIL